MKAIQIPFGFFPDPSGGTEVYVAALAQELQNKGVDILVAAPGHQSREYIYGAIRVRRFPVSDVADAGELYGIGDTRAAAAFGRILDEEQPDIMHLHALTRGASLRLVRQAKQRGIPVVMTYHTPTVSCQRGTLLRWGAEVCDGELDLHRCTACTLQSHGVPVSLASAVAQLPVGVGQLVAKSGLRGKAATALRMRDLMKTRQEVFRAVVTEVDHLVAVCEWVQSILIRNGVPLEKVALSRQGLLQSRAAQRSQPGPQAPRLPLRVAFLGRLTPAKGLEVLLQALAVVPDAPLKLDIYGIAEGGEGDAYAQRLRSMAEADRRFGFMPPLDNQDVISALQGYHVLAVPSQGLETGPLVVLEAFAAGIPVIGSDLGGIAELIRHERNGLLVRPGAPHLWAQAIRKLIHEPELLSRLRSGIEPPRSMGEVAEEMVALYRSLVPAATHTAEAAWV